MTEKQETAKPVSKPAKVTPVKETKLDVTKLNVYQKLAIARKRISEKEIKKSGNTPKYSYLELKDFLPTTNVIFAELELIGTFNISRETGIEVATLRITNASKPEETIVFATETAEVNLPSGQPIQNLGSKHTYLRRYLWLEALELTESDTVEAQNKTVQYQQYQPRPQYVQQPQYVQKPMSQQAPQVAPPVAPQVKDVSAIPCTQKQVEVLEKLTQDTPERKAKLLEYYKVNDLKELNVQQAAVAIKRLEEHGGDTDE